VTDCKNAHRKPEIKVGNGNSFENFKTIDKRVINRIYMKGLESAQCLK